MARPLAAIEAAEILGGLLDSDDEEIVEAAHEAMAMAGELRDDEEVEGSRKAL